jgi:hypothetical protein
MEAICSSELEETIIFSTNIARCGTAGHSVAISAAAAGTLVRAISLQDKHCNAHENIRGVAMQHNEKTRIHTGHAVVYLLRQYATSRKVADSIPDEVTGFFNKPNPSSRTMALGSTQPLTEMITRNLPGE